MADTPIAFPDAVQVVITYLSGFLAGRNDTAEVHHKVPNPRPARFILVFRTGGPRENIVVDGAQLTIECWADTDEAAQDLAQAARAALLAIRSDVIAGTVIYQVTELSGPGDLPDPTSDQSRQTWSVIAHARGADLQPAP